MSLYYRKQCNGHGLKALYTNVQIPDVRLGVGVGENLCPQQMKVEYQTGQHYVVRPEPESMTYEEMQLKMHSVPLTDASFPSTFYFGELVKGVQ